MRINEEEEGRKKINKQIKVTTYYWVWNVRCVGHRVRRAGGGGGGLVLVRRFKQCDELAWKLFFFVSLVTSTVRAFFSASFDMTMHNTIVITRPASEPDRLPRPRNTYLPVALCPISTVR